MNWNIIELENQHIFLTKDGIIRIKVVVPMPHIHADLVIKHAISKHNVCPSCNIEQVMDFDMDKWHFNKQSNKWFSGIGEKNERS